MASQAEIDTTYVLWQQADAEGRRLRAIATAASNQYGPQSTQFRTADNAAANAEAQALFARANWQRASSGPTWPAFLGLLVLTAGAYTVVEWLRSERWDHKTAPARARSRLARR